MKGYYKGFYTWSTRVGMCNIYTIYFKKKIKRRVKIIFYNVDRGYWETKLLITH